MPKLDELDKKYSSKQTEANKYTNWVNSGYFKPTKKGEPFSIVLPPPNVTGILHLGHAWDASIQDTIIRYKKLKGFKTLWIPGMDHAGIATQTKFEKYLAENQLPTRIEMGRKKFIDELMIWKNKQQEVIQKQWAQLGLSLDYSKQRFTMDSDANKIVNKVFTDLYNNKLIYRGLKLVNWDIKLQTAISDIEVIYKPVKTKLYYFKYFLNNKKKKYIEIATTRPETMFGDFCVFVNPNDKRYKKLINKTVLNPVNDKPLIVLSDKYIDIDFGSGAMKCTPAHDFNDYDLAKKHNLEMLNIMNKDGTLNQECGEYQGLDRLVARELIVKDLTKKGYVAKVVDNYETQIGYSERTNEIIEPMLSLQWFMNMKPLAKKIIDAQKKKNPTKSVDFLPKRFEKVLLGWLTNIDDWCISRQLWWGHQLPVWYHKQTNEIYVNEVPPTNIKEWVRDEDVLDTWFSSGLWPLVCLNWNQNTSKLFSEYFPTSILVTGYDIVFFWVARMMMLSNYFTDKTPFKKIYIHGLIRDENGKKMSKSLGNGIDPIDIINEYGADTLRLFLTSSSTIGEDLNFSYTKVKASWNFLNKLWNSARFILGYTEDNKKYNKLNNLSEISIWIINKFNHVLHKFTKQMEEYNFVVANKILYDFIWNDFCNTYIELAKLLIINKQEKEQVLSVMLLILKNILIMLHPQCPFITEEIYLKLPNKTKQSIMLENWPKPIDIAINENVVNILNNIINTIRRIRLDNNIAIKEQLVINILTKKKIKYFVKNKDFFNRFLLIVNAQINNVSNIPIIGNKISEVLNDFTIEIPFNKNYDEEKIKLLKLIEKLEAEIQRSNNILSNNNFILKAPKQKVDEEKNKLKAYEEQLKNAKDLLEDLNLNKNITSNKDENC